MKRMFVLIGFIVSFGAYAKDDYKIIPSISSLNFATVKNQYIIETASIIPTKGLLNQDGTFSITLPISTIKTGISIRDERLKTLLFEESKFPKVVVTGKVDFETISNEPKLISLLVDVKIYGKVNTVTFPVVVMSSDDYILVSSYNQSVIGTSDFGIPSENLIKLASTVGGINISDRAPISFILAFSKL